MKIPVTVVAAALVLSVGAAQDGAQVYEQCSVCHGAEGEGEGGTGPALAGNQNLQEASYHISRI